MCFWKSQSWFLKKQLYSNLTDSTLSTLFTHRHCSAELKHGNPLTLLVKDTLWEVEWPFTSSSRSVAFQYTLQFDSSFYSEYTLILVGSLFSSCFSLNKVFRVPSSLYPSLTCRSLSFSLLHSLFSLSRLDKLKQNKSSNLLSGT